jgi:hypothetical protein
MPETTATWHINYTTSCPIFVTRNVHKVKRHGEKHHMAYLGLSSTVVGVITQLMNEFYLQT